MHFMSTFCGLTFFCCYASERQMLFFCQAFLKADWGREGCMLSIPMQLCTVFTSYKCLFLFSFINSTKFKVKLRISPFIRNLTTTNFPFFWQLQNASDILSNCLKALLNICTAKMQLFYHHPVAFIWLWKMHLFFCQCSRKKEFWIFYYAWYMVKHTREFS